MSEDKDLEERLAALEADNGGTAKKREKPSPKVAIAGAAGIAAIGLIAYLALPSDDQEPAMQTAQPAEFQAEGMGSVRLRPSRPLPRRNRRLSKWKAPRMRPFRSSLPRCKPSSKKCGMPLRPTTARQQPQWKL